MTRRLAGMMFGIYLFCSSASCFAGNSVSSDDVVDRVKLKPMNNFVSELLRVRIPASPHNEYIFSNPRDGWVFFATSVVTADPAGAIAVSIDSAGRSQAIINHKTGKTQEAMRWLVAGPHKIDVWEEKKIRSTLVIRSMPEIISIRFTGDMKSPDGSPYKISERSASGADRLYLYYWDWLRKNMVQNCNVVQNAPVSTEEMKGKKSIGGNYFFTKNPEQLYEAWSKAFAPPNSGVIIDEFIVPAGGTSGEGAVLGGNMEKPIMDVIRKIRANPKLKGDLYAFLGLPWNGKIELSKLLMDTIMSCNYKWVPEFYLWEPSTKEEAKIFLDRDLRQKMREFRKQFPGCERSAVPCLSILEMWDSMAQVDFKVWLDMQFHLMANDSAFKGIYGITAWANHYADPETMLWLSHLYRHYCIEGKTEMLSPEYGFSLMLDYLDSEFGDGAKAWKFSPAKEGSIQVKKIGDLPFTRVYLPKGTKTLPVLKRSENRPNTLRQEIKNLRPGKLYSLKMYACDIADRETRQHYALSVTLDGVGILEKRSRQDIQQTTDACWNYFYRVFRAKTGRAEIIIADWKDGKTPGGPAGQEVLVDLVQIQPLFEPNEGK